MAQTAKTAKKSKPAKVAKASKPVKTAKPAKASKPAKAVKPVKASKPAKPAKKKMPFKPGDFVVYPTHGVGKVVSIEIQEIAGHKLKLFVISFDRDRMTLRVPVSKATTSGLRKLSSRKKMDNAMETLKARARVKRTMWSRRAQEYEAKINSGDPIFIAEVVRDLHRKADQPDQSFSERQIFESARDRLARELAAVDLALGTDNPSVASTPSRPTKPGADYTIAALPPANVPGPSKDAPSYEAVASSESTTAPAAAGRASATSASVKPQDGPWKVQLGAFGVPGNAERLWEKLSGRAEIKGRSRLLVKSGRLTVLSAGGYQSRSEAEAACSALKRAEQDCLVAR